MWYIIPSFIHSMPLTEMFLGCSSLGKAFLAEVFLGCSFLEQTFFLEKIFFRCSSQGEVPLAEISLAAPWRKAPQVELFPGFSSQGIVGISVSWVYLLWGKFPWKSCFLGAVPRKEMSLEEAFLGATPQREVNRDIPQGLLCVTVGLSLMHRCLSHSIISYSSFIHFSPGITISLWNVNYSVKQSAPLTVINAIADQYGHSNNQ